MAADNFDGILLDRDGNIINDTEGGEEMAQTLYPYVCFDDGEARDILYMLADYIDGLEDRLDAYGPFAVAGDEGLQEEQANLAVAIRLHDKIDAVFNEKEVKA